MKFLSTPQKAGLENILKQVNLPVMRLAFENAIKYLKHQGYYTLALEAEYKRQLHELNLNGGNKHD